MKFTKINMNGSDVFKEIRTHRQSQEGETPEILVQGEATDDMKSENEGSIYIFIKKKMKKNI